MSTRRAAGRVVRKISATTNDAEHRKETLTCVATILTPFRAEPKMVNFGQVERDAGPQRRTIRITRGDGGPLALKLLPIREANLQASLREIDPGERFDLDVEINPPWPSGTMQAMLDLETGLPEMPQDAIRVYARIAPRLSTSPSRFTIPQSVKSELKLTARLRWSGGDPGRILEATSSDPRLPVRVQQRLNQQMVTIRVPEGYTPPAGRPTAVTIRTDDQQAPTLRIPIHVARAAVAERRARPPKPTPAARKPPTEGKLRSTPTITLSADGQELIIELGERMRMELVLIPPGEFVMGSPTSDQMLDDAEGPQHQVRLSRPWYMGKYEVTQDQWQAVMGYNPSGFKGSDLPVERVSWNECQKFCAKLSHKVGRHIRLPTEAEWEYACRAGTTTPYHFGETISTGQANYDGRRISSNGSDGVFLKGTCRNKTTPAGSFPPNAWGLYDMYGNVGEWCGDWFDCDYYAHSPRVDPSGPPFNGQRERVVRGGSWSDPPEACRATHRAGSEPNVHNHAYGFRVVVETE